MDPVVQEPSATPLNAMTAVRVLMMLFGGWLVQNGWITQNDLATGVGAFITLAGVGWAFYKNYAHVATLKQAMTTPAVNLAKGDTLTVPAVKVLAPLLLVLLACGFFLPLAACQTTGVSTVAQDAEKADTWASLAYGTVGTGLNAYEAAALFAPGPVAKAEAIKLQAWNDYVIVHTAYRVSQPITAAMLAALTADASAASALTGKAIPVPAQ